MTTVNSPERLDLTDRLPKLGSIEASTPTMLLIVAVGAIATQLLLRMPWCAMRARSASQSSVAEVSTSRWPPRCPASSASVSGGRMPRSQRLPRKLL